MHPDTVAAARQLTVRWIEALAPEGSTVLSAAGAWPLLALLEYAATGPARDELTAAVGLPPERSGAAAVDLLAELDAVPDLSAALGIWTDRLLELTPEFSDLVPKAHRGVLTGDQEADQATLDIWAHECTRGLIERMPITVNQDTRLALATALTLKTEWQVPFFREWPRRLSETAYRWLGRGYDDLDVVSIIDGTLTLVRVAGTGSIDVLLALGESEAEPASVLTRALAADAGITGSELLRSGVVGPGLSTAPGLSPDPLLRLDLPAFEVSSDHDLMAHANVFGLESARDSSRGHFPGLSADPLAISQANQTTVAKFHATGFEAASVTAMAMEAGGMPPPPSGQDLVLSLDRPFGFVAVHRPSGLPLVAGWAAEDSWVPWTDWVSVS